MFRQQWPSQPFEYRKSLLRHKRSHRKRKHHTILNKKNGNSQTQNFMTTLSRRHTTSTTHYPQKSTQETPFRKCNIDTKECYQPTRHEHDNGLVRLKYQWVNIDMFGRLYRNTKRAIGNRRYKCSSPAATICTLIKYITSHDGG